MKSMEEYFKTELLADQSMLTRHAADLAITLTTAVKAIEELGEDAVWTIDWDEVSRDAETLRLVAHRILNSRLALAHQGRLNRETANAGS